MSYVQLDHDFAKFLEPQQYVDAINNNDNAACVLRLQLLAEQFLNVLLDDYPDEKQKAFLKTKYFDQKLQLAVALGMPTELANALKHLNKIRNRFSHNLGAKIDENLDLKPYINLINEFRAKDISAEFNISALDILESLDNISTETAIQGVNSMTGEKQTLQIKDGDHPALAISTYILLTKAGIWAINALKRANKLKATQLPPEKWPQL
ncbi:hypothetical protein [Alcaligenes faecalis]|uniref:hypothetical protein n=1 Tax=Alcaligenes faecalis TaxID=511 RepID=UPI0034D49135